MKGRSRRAAVGWLIALAATCPGLPAQGQLGPDGTPITTSDYTIDLTRGVVVSSSRVVGLSGAATSLAQGVEGGLQNPSAVAYRGAQWPDWYDYWLALGLTYPFESGDFYNSGRVVGSSNEIDQSSTFFLIPVVNLQQQMEQAQQQMQQYMPDMNQLMQQMQQQQGLPPEAMEQMKKMQEMFKQR